jgi:hypothetical protein
MLAPLRRRGKAGKQSVASRACCCTAAHKAPVPSGTSRRADITSIHLTSTANADAAPVHAPPGNVTSSTVCWNASVTQFIARGWARPGPMQFPRRGGRISEAFRAVVLQELRNDGKAVSRPPLSVLRHVCPPSSDRYASRSWLSANDRPTPRRGFIRGRGRGRRAGPAARTGDSFRRDAVSPLEPAVWAFADGRARSASKRCAYRTRKGVL